MLKRPAVTTALLTIILLAGPFVWAQNAPDFLEDEEEEAASEEDDEFSDFEEEFGTDSAGSPFKVFDPLSGYNRIMFKVNDKFYFWLVKPAARGYRYVVPKRARISVKQAYHNLYFPLRFVNNLLQFKLKKAGTELGRFLVNSTAGVGGLFDPAQRYLKWRPSNEDFGQTFAFYGVGDGFPVTLPFLGPSNLRDGIALAPRALLNPVFYLADFKVNVAVSAGERFNYASLHIGAYESMKKDALDPYTFVRDAYKQNRDKQIKE